MEPAPPPTEDAAWTQETAELLPDFVQGWYLLSDAGLDTSERNLVMAALKGDYTLHRVAQELRNQWGDLRRRDQSTRGSGWWMDTTDPAFQSDPEDDAGPQWVDHDLSDEGQALVVEAQQEIQSAHAMIDQGRRTLKQARARQHQVRMSRRYYKSSYQASMPPMRDHNKTVINKTSITCLRCGGDHAAGKCPKQNPSAQQAQSAEESAPFMCFLDGSSPGALQQIAPVETFPVEAWAMGTSERLITTQEAVRQGKAVLDGGATKTLGSVNALEKLMALNSAQHGHTGIRSIDTHNKPTFGFGNSSKDQCVSTAVFSIQADQREGSLTVHALDRGDGPILFSIEALRKLGAVIDFAEDLLVFRNLNDRKVIQLERSSTGHQLLPLAQDWYSQSEGTQQPVPSLRSYI